MDCGLGPEEKGSPDGPAEWDGVRGEEIALQMPQRKTECRVLAGCCAASWAQEKCIVRLAVAVVDVVVDCWGILERKNGKGQESKVQVEFENTVKCGFSLGVDLVRVH